MGVPNENIFRRKKKSPIKSKIIISLIIIICVFFLLSFFIYTFLNYSKSIHIPLDKWSINEYIDALGKISDIRYTLTIKDTISDILNYHLKLWYIYPIILFFLFILTQKSRNDFKGMEHGSARWMDETEIKQLNKEAEAAEKKIPLGKDTYLSLNSSKVANLNEIVIGGSGAGKSFRKIKPDILQMTGSYVITDPKGELYRDTAKVLKKHGYKVRVLNLVNLNYSNSYNPFSYITSEKM